MNDVKAEFSAAISPVFSQTCSLQNNFNMLKFYSIKTHATYLSIIMNNNNSLVTEKKITTGLVSDTHIQGSVQNS